MKNTKKEEMIKNKKLVLYDHVKELEYLRWYDLHMADIRPCGRTRSLGKKPKN